MVSQVTAKQDDRISATSIFYFPPCIFIALENLSGDGVWMLGCLHRKAHVAQHKKRRWAKANAGMRRTMTDRELRKLSRAELLELLFGKRAGRTNGCGSAARK